MAAFKVLVVEDSEEMGELLKKILDREGYQVLLAKDPDEALAKLRNDQVKVVVYDFQAGCEEEFLRVAQEQATIIPLASLDLPAGNWPGPEPLPRPVSIGRLTQAIKDALVGSEPAKEATVEPG